MKPKVFSGYVSSVFYAALLSVALPLSAEEAKNVEIHLSEIELQEIFNNPTRSYVYVGREVSNIADVVDELSKLDDNQSSLVHGLNAHIQKGFNIGNYDAVAQALQESEQLLIQHADALGEEKATALTRSLDAIIEQVIEERLNLDAELLSFLKDSVVAKEDETRSCCKPNPHCHGLRLLVVNEKLDVLGKAKFREDVTFKDDVKFEDDVVFEDDVTIDGTLSVAAQAIDCNLTVGCNILMSNSTSATVGNILKGGVSFISNFGTNNTFVGSSSGNFTMTGTSNSGFGTNTLLANTAGSSNTAVGTSALVANTAGSDNAAFGNNALTANTTGINNTAVGFGALSANVVGSSNTALGFNAGNVVTSGSNNIFIAHVGGAAAESNTIRIGTTQTRCFIQGISGVTTGLSAIALLVDANGQLGTISSSATRKHNIQDMNNASERIYRLRPVTFAFNGDASETEQYGLIAEEVDEVFPELVAKDQNGRAYAVHYETLPALLLNEVQKLAARVAALEAIRQ